MGFSMFSSSCGSNPNPKLPNPNPKKFNIEVANQVGDYCICIIAYPDCTTFDGKKVLVFKDSSINIMKREIIDPHFLGKQNDPIARFPATKDGISDAVSFVASKCNPTIDRDIK